MKIGKKLNVTVEDVDKVSNVHVEVFSVIPKYPG
jgi:hypothetical protein